MAKMKKAGRPKKKNAVKSGELSPGLVRFSFIADEWLILKMKGAAKNHGISIKEFMRDLLKGVKVNESGIVNKKTKKPATKKSKIEVRNEALLLKFKKKNLL